jgi:hypothetical protein
VSSGPGARARRRSYLACRSSTVTRTPELPVPRTLAELLDLEVLDRDLFRGFNVGIDRHRLFGGQVAAQALRPPASQFRTTASRTRSTVTSSGRGGPSEP